MAVVLSENDKRRVKEALAGVEDVIVAGGPAARAIWDILSALRGPDGSGVSKDTTTAPLRVRTFPKMWLYGNRYRGAQHGRGAGYGANVAAVQQFRLPVRSSPYDHFSNHVYAADEALKAIGR